MADLNAAIDKFKTGNGRPPALSPNVVDLVREAWLFASVDHGVSQVRFGTPSRCVAQFVEFAAAGA